MIRAFALLSILFLSGCSLTLPSFYDDNESWAANNMVFYANKVNCYSSKKEQDIWKLKDALAWLMLYSEAKGSTDVLEMIYLTNETLKTFDGNTSSELCMIKKQILIEQTSDISRAVMRRY